MSGKCHRVSDFELGPKDESEIARQTERDVPSRRSNICKDMGWMGDSGQNHLSQYSERNSKK